MIEWKLRYSKRYRYDIRLNFLCVAGAIGPTGIPTDSSYHWHWIRVPGIEPSYACYLRCPDSLTLNATGTGVEPNPFNVEYVVWNSGHISSDIVLADINFPIEQGLSLDVSTPKTRNCTVKLLPGDSLTISWWLHVSNRETPRIVSISAYAYTDEGNPILTGPDGPCSKEVSIAGVSPTHIESVETKDFMLGPISPNPFNEFTIIHYELGADAHARLTVHDALGRNVATLVNARQKAGKYSVRFDASALPGGMYLSRLEAAAYTAVRIMVVGM